MATGLSYSDIVSIYSLYLIATLFTVIHCSLATQRATHTVHFDITVTLLTFLFAHLLTQDDWHQILLRTVTRAGGVGKKSNTINIIHSKIFRLDIE